MSKKTINGAQLQHLLIDRFGLSVSVDEDGEFLSRKDGRSLRVETVEKMLHIENSGWQQVGKKSVKTW